MRCQWEQGDLLLQGWKERVQLRGEMFVVYVTCPFHLSHILILTRIVS
jgi:hypothetical protein